MSRTDAASGFKNNIMSSNKPLDSTLQTHNVLNNVSPLYTSIVDSKEEQNELEIEDYATLVASLPPLNLYTNTSPSASLHGNEQFVAALPAKDRALKSLILSQSPVPKWHLDALRVGFLFENDSVFVKQRKGGSISLLYEQMLRQRGVHAFDFTILDGTICIADGLGFVFAGRVPCSKNIKRLWSVFVSRTGRVSKRMGDCLVRDNEKMLPLFAIGQTITMVIDLNLYRAAFQTRAPNGEVLARCHVDLSDIASLVDASSGYLCAAITEEGQFTCCLSIIGMVVRLKPGSTEPLYLPPIAATTPNRQYRNRHYSKSEINNINWNNFPKSSSLNPETPEYIPIFRAAQPTILIENDKKHQESSEAAVSLALLKALGMNCDAAPDGLTRTTSYRPNDMENSVNNAIEILRENRTDKEAAWKTLLMQNSQDNTPLMPSNRGVSVSSSSTAVVGSLPDEFLSEEAMLLLTQLQGWQIDNGYPTTLGGSGDDELQVPYLLEGNRTVSAPPASRSLF